MRVKQMIRLRPYQNKARYGCNALLNARRHPCYVCPTGGGKTKTSTIIIQDRNNLKRRVYVLTPQVEIFEQWMKDLTLAGLDPGYINSEGIKGANRMVYVCMPLSLVNILHLVPEHIWPDEIITDESHHSAADSWERIYSFFPDATRMGLTATPQRTDGHGLDHLYTDIVDTVSMKELIQQGFLAKPLTIVPEEYHMKVPIKNGDYDPKLQADLLGKPKIVGNVLEHYSDLFGGLPVLVACSTYDHAKRMTKAFQDAGWQWDHIHSKLPSYDRKSMLRKIGSGKLNGLCTVGIGVEGMDIPGLYGLIWLRRTLSLTIFLQFNGRVLRPMSGKKYGIILDPVGNTFIHGMPDAHRTWDLRGIAQEKEPRNSLDEEAPVMRICPGCRTANAVELTHCWFCGCDLSIKRKTKIPQMVDGELVIIEDEGTAQKLRDRVEHLKAEQQQHVDEEKRKEENLEELTSSGKASVIKDNLFGGKRKLFNDTIKNFL